MGLVGRNDRQTTLFRLIRGELSWKQGRLNCPDRPALAAWPKRCLKRNFSTDTVLAADTERAELLAEAERADDPNRIAEIQTRLADIDAWSAEGRVIDLKGLGFFLKKTTDALFGLFRRMADARGLGRRFICRA